MKDDYFKSPCQSGVADYSVFTKLAFDFSVSLLGDSILIFCGLHHSSSLKYSVYFILFYIICDTVSMKVGKLRY